MPVGYRNAAGVDFDDLFDPDVQGDGPTASFLRTASGVPLRYADISYGSKGPNVGYRTSAGVDVSNLWAAKGTATYVTDGGVPNLVSGAASLTVDEGGSAQAFVTFRTNRTAAWGGTGSGSSGTWLTAGNAADFDVRWDVVQPPTGQFSGTTGQWLPINSDRQVQVQVSVGPGPNDASSFVGLRLRIRHRASGTVYVDKNVSLQADITRTGV